MLSVLQITYKPKHTMSNKSHLNTLYASGLLSGKDINWTNDVSYTGVKIFNPIKHHTYYYHGGGREKYLEKCHEDNLKKMREYIEEHKHNPKALQKGYDTYRHEKEDYIRIIAELGVSVDLPKKPESK